MEIRGIFRENLARIFVYPSYVEIIISTAAQFYFAMWSYRKSQMAFIPISSVCSLEFFWRDVAMRYYRISQIANRVHDLLPSATSCDFCRLWCCDAIRSHVANHTLKITFHLVFLYRLKILRCDLIAITDRNFCQIITSILVTCQYLFRCDLHYLSMDLIAVIYSRPKHATAILPLRP